MMLTDFGRAGASSTRAEVKASSSASVTVVPGTRVAKATGSSPA